MDRKLYAAIVRNDIQSFKSIIQSDELILNETDFRTGNNALHLIARFGHTELAAEAVAWKPDMIGAQNEKRETPVHEACREGHTEMMKMFLQVDPYVIYKTSTENETVLMAACKKGRLEIVKHLLSSYQQLLSLEIDGPTTSLHLAASQGFTDIVKQLLTIRSDFASKRDLCGCSPLHYACGKGHLDTAKELLAVDADLMNLRDDEGRTPLHWAASRGRINIMDEILSMSLDAAEAITNSRETVLHLGVKNNQFDAVKYLMETLNTRRLRDLPDSEGNTILHLATAGKLTTMLNYILKVGVDLNALNQNGETALDLVVADTSNSASLQIMPILTEAGAKHSDQLPPFSSEIQHTIEPSNIRMSNHVPSPWQKASPSIDSLDNPQRGYRKHHRHPRQRKIENQTEGLRNARNTITIIAVLIATVTFASGINPPGGYNQVTGKAILARKTPFKVFLMCNIIALFLSLGIVIALVSIIPFTRRSMMKLLVVTHKLMWASVSFMASAYIAAVWTIMPHVDGTKWVLASLVSIGAGCTLTMLVSSGVMLVGHLQRKFRWRNGKRTSKSPNGSLGSRIDEMRQIKKKDGESSPNSDVDSSDKGYHLY